MNSWYRYSSYRTQYQGEPRKLAMAGCGIYSIFFGVFLLFVGIVTTVVSFSVFSFNDRDGPKNVLGVLGPIVLSLGIVMIIVGIILMCCLRSMGYSSAAANLQPNQILLNGQIVTTSPAPYPGTGPGPYTGTGPAPYPGTGLQPQGQFYPPQTGYAPYPTQALPFQGQPTQTNPSAPPSYNLPQYSQVPSTKEQTYSFVPK